MNFQQIPIGAIRPSPSNPRKQFEMTLLKELADTITAQGIIEPLVLRPLPSPVTKNKQQEAVAKALGIAGEPKYEIVAGERRWRAAALAKLEAVPAIVRELDDQQVWEIQNIENYHREDLTPLEEALAWEEAIKFRGYTIASLGEKLGLQRSTIYSRIKLNSLSAPVREALKSGKIDASKAGLIARLADPAAQLQALRETQPTKWGSDGLSYRKLEDEIERRFQRKLKDAPWDAKEEGIASSVSCEACRKRSGNMIEFDIADPQLCTDLTCWAKKQQAHTSRILDKAREAGQAVMTPKEYEKVEHSSQYVDLSETNYEDEGKSFKTCLKDKPVAITVAVDDTGEVHELVKRADLKQAGVKLGFSPHADGSYAKQQAAARKKAILDNKIADALSAAAVAKCEATKPTIVFWRLLALAAVESCWHDSLVDIAKRRGAAEKAADAREKLEAQLPAYTEENCRALLLEILLLRGMRGGYGMDSLLKQALALYKIDRKKITAAVMAEAKNPKTKRAGIKTTTLSFYGGGKGFGLNADGVYTKPNRHRLPLTGAIQVTASVETAKSKDGKWVMSYDVGHDGEHAWRVSAKPANGRKTFADEPSAVNCGLEEIAVQIRQHLKEARGIEKERLQKAYGEVNQIIVARLMPKTNSKQ